LRDEEVNEIGGGELEERRRGRLTGMTTETKLRLLVV
jgi:hypothetical protein